ncbi:MAG TPA: glycosyltransferase family 2 protein [Methanolinea sp.]|jgi:glycosyltransferase involved in cell wall biosynthesis|nr:glycosyltransferase family 2 protein [Methanolinea sp.]
MKGKASIIIPVFNEEDILAEYPVNLFPVLEDIFIKYSMDFEVILVDDGSTDRSWLKISELQRLKLYLKTYKMPQNVGMGGAVRKGIELSEGEIIITLDADLTFKPKEIDILLTEYVKNPVDCVSGSPYLKDDLMLDVPLVRKILSKAVNYIYCLELGQRITSVSPIFRLYRSEIFSTIPLTSNNFEVNAEILSKMILSGYTVREVPAHLFKREHGQSKAKIWKSIRNHSVIIGKIFKVKFLKGNWN